MAIKEYWKKYKDRRAREQLKKELLDEVYKKEYLKHEGKAVKKKAARDVQSKYFPRKRPSIQSARIDPREEGMFHSPSIFGPPEDFFRAGAPRVARRPKKTKRKKTKKRDYEDGGYDSGWF
jgi:hypothetical protein